MDQRRYCEIIVRAIPAILPPSGGGRREISLIDHRDSSARNFFALSSPDSRDTPGM